MNVAIRIPSIVQCTSTYTMVNHVIALNKTTDRQVRETRKSV